jgi:hypothetical protein
MMMLATGRWLLVTKEGSDKIDRLPEARDQLPEASDQHPVSRPLIPYNRACLI